MTDPDKTGEKSSFQEQPHVLLIGPSTNSESLEKTAAQTLENQNEHVNFLAISNHDNIEKTFNEINPSDVKSVVLANFRKFYKDFQDRADAENFTRSAANFCRKNGKPLVLLDYNPKVLAKDLGLKENAILINFNDQQYREALKSAVNQHVKARESDRVLCLGGGKQYDQEFAYGDMEYLESKGYHPEYHRAVNEVEIREAGEKLQNYDVIIVRNIQKLQEFHDTNPRLLRSFVEKIRKSDKPVIFYVDLTKLAHDTPQSKQLKKLLEGLMVIDFKHDSKALISGIDQLKHEELVKESTARMSDPNIRKRGSAPGR